MDAETQETLSLILFHSDQSALRFTPFTTYIVPAYITSSVSEMTKSDAKGLVYLGRKRHL
ncbi:hypothetical protein BG004_002712, partial [Podila humilis]